MPLVTLHPVCPSKRGNKIVLKSGGFGWRSCHSYACPLCGPRKVRRQAAVLSHIATHAPHARWVTLSDAPRDSAKRMKAMLRLRRTLQRRVGPVAIGWVTEISKNNACHIHALVHGSPIEPGTIEEIWGANVDDKDAHPKTGGYMLKAALHQPGSIQRLEHFELNAGRSFRTLGPFYGEHARFGDAWRATLDPTAVTAGVHPDDRTPVVELSLLVSSTHQ